MTHKRLRVAIVVLALVLAQLGRNPTTARAPALTVNTTSDLSGTGCLATPQCSLRRAINEANANPGADIIQFNIPGTDPGCDGAGVCTIQPASALPALTGDGTAIDGYTQPGAALATKTGPAVLKIELDGTNAGGSADGLTVNSAGNVIQGLVINRFSSHGIYISGSGATGNTVSGNTIGADVSGTAVLSNTYGGVVIDAGAQDNVIGGDTAEERNVISGNGTCGVCILDSGTVGNTISGNYIGLAADGATALGNAAGIWIRSGAQLNIIGGDTPGERNVISGNDTYGVAIRHGGTMSNTISGNTIGLAADGTSDLGNGSHGVWVFNDAQNNTVGGSGAGERNVISGNGGNGVRIEISDGNIIAGNAIGTDGSGVLNRGNDLGGVSICNGSQNNTVGPNNVIAHNGGGGVWVYDNGTAGNAITQNGIFSNGGLGIGLGNGANGSIAAPTILSHTFGSPVGVAGTACAGCTVELFANGDTDGEGETFIGDTVADGSGAFNVAVPVGPLVNQPHLTATATDVVSGTSEFSAVYTVEVKGVYLPLVVR